MSRVAVIGAGAWGTALAIQAARAGNVVTLWARDPARAAAIAATRDNPHLVGTRVPDAIAVTADLPTQADAMLLVVPVQHMRAVVSALPPDGPPLLVCAKGVEAGTRLLPLEILADCLPGRAAAVLSGPNFASEIARGLPAASVVAAADPNLRAQLTQLLATPEFRLYGNDDPIGVQAGGAAKNVIAIAAGAVMGAGLGENARAALITRGVAELSRLITALGGRTETAMGLSGLGDLLLTCTGPSSRNFSLGHALGKGESLEKILAGRSSVTEGVATAPALIARARNLDMPICQAFAALVTNRASLSDLMAGLLARPRRDE